MVAYMQMWFQLKLSSYQFNIVVALIFNTISFFIFRHLNKVLFKMIFFKFKTYFFAVILFIWYLCNDSIRAI